MLKQRKTATMTLTVDFDRVTLQAPGVLATVIQRPSTVSIKEWEQLWGATEYPIPMNNKKPFTHEDALANHVEFRKS